MSEMRYFFSADELRPVKWCVTFFFEAEILEDFVKKIEKKKKTLSDQDLYSLPLFFQFTIWFRSVDKHPCIRLCLYLSKHGLCTPGAEWKEGSFVQSSEYFECSFLISLSSVTNGIIHVQCGWLPANTANTLTVDSTTSLQSSVEPVMHSALTSVGGVYNTEAETWWAGLRSAFKSLSVKVVWWIV